MSQRRAAVLKTFINCDFALLKSPEFLTVFQIFFVICKNARLGKMGKRLALIDLLNYSES